MKEDTFASLSGRGALHNMLLTLKVVFIVQKNKKSDVRLLFIAYQRIGGAWSRTSTPEKTWLVTFSY